MKNEEILRKILETKLHLMDQVLIALPEAVGLRAKKAGLDLITAIHKESGLYLDRQEDTAPGEDKLRSIAVE